MNKKLFVGGISYNTKQDGLRQAFEEAGEVVSATIIMERDEQGQETGRSKGFGFVEMADDEGAKKAIEMWNGKELDGRTLVVNESRPREDRPQGGGFRGGNGGGGNNFRSGGFRNDR